MNILYTEQYIKEKIARLGVDINEYYKKKVDPVIAVVALKGGTFFYVDLVRNFQFPVEMGVISTSHYPNGLPGNAEVEINFVDADVFGKNVLLVDEICFTGKSLNVMKNVLQNRGAQEVRTVVLVDQNKPDAIHSPTWAAIQYDGDGWLYGYGMDINGLHRNIPELRIKDEEF